MAEQAARSGSSEGQGSTSGTGTPPGWTAGLTPEFRDNPEFTRYRDQETFLRSHLSLVKKFSDSSRVLLPGADTSEEDRQAFYKKWGRPESADRYELKLPEGTPVDENFLKGAREAFHAIGLNGTQAQQLAEFYVGQLGAAATVANQQIEEGIGALQKQWGHEFDANVALAARAVEQLSSGEGAIEGLADWIKSDARIGSHPVMLRLMHFLGRAMSEDTALEGNQPLSDEGAAEVRRKIDAMRADPKHPLNDASAPGHRAAVVELQRLYDQIFGQEEGR